MSENSRPGVTKSGSRSQNHTENGAWKEDGMPRRAVSEAEHAANHSSEFARALASLGGPSYLFSDVHGFPGVTALVDVLEPVILGVKRADWLHGFPSTLRPGVIDLRIPEVTPADLAATAMDRWRLAEAGALRRLVDEQDQQIVQVVHCLIVEALEPAVSVRFGSWPKSRVDRRDVVLQLHTENFERWIESFDPSISQLSTFIYSHARPNAMSRKGQRSVGLRADHLSVGPASYAYQEDDIVSRIMSEAAENGMDDVSLLHYYGYSYAEISRAIGVTVGAARTRVSRHLREHRLRLGLDPRGKAPTLETEGD